VSPEPSTTPALELGGVAVADEGAGAAAAAGGDAADVGAAVPPASGEGLHAATHTSPAIHTAAPPRKVPMMRSMVAGLRSPINSWPPVGTSVSPAPETVLSPRGPNARRCGVAAQAHGLLLAPATDAPFGDPKMTKLLRSSIALSILAGAGVAHAEIIEVGPADDVEGAINALMPGDELVLAGGTYTLTDAWHITMVGTEQAPIVVRAKDGETPHLQRPSADQNVIDFDMVRYATFRGIEVSGGSHGLRLIDVSFMTIEGCHVHDTGDVAISANSGGDYEGLRILRNNIHHTNNTGEGMYLGCNNDDCRVHDSLIEGNWVHHTNGPTIEQGDGIEIKEGSYGNIIRDNIIHDTNYPCILTYGTVGNGAPNIIERNAMWNCGDHGIQSAADAIIRNNIILGSGSNGIAMQPHQSGAPSNLEVVHNTVLHPSNSAITVSGAAGSILIANNAVYAQNGAAIDVNGNLALVVAAGNVGVGGFSGPSSGYDESGDIGTDFVSASYAGAPPMDVFPASGSALIGAADPRYLAPDDFNGSPRDGAADVGAYLFDAAGNPGWTLDGGFKGEVISSSAATTGSGGSGGGGGAAGPAGAGGSSAVGPSAGSGGAGLGADPEGDGDSGCSCRAAGGHGSPNWLALAATLGCLAWSRRRPSRAKPRSA
jgi:hypothetical protein